MPLTQITRLSTFDSDVGKMDGNFRTLSFIDRRREIRVDRQLTLLEETSKGFGKLPIALPFLPDPLREPSPAFGGLVLAPRHRLLSFGDLLQTVRKESLERFNQPFWIG